ncbi:hypothetical protein O9929_23625 [Vibrio lentus]|nr:hypothetical protein [Vibrio lentus]
MVLACHDRCGVGRRRSDTWKNGRVTSAILLIPMVSQVQTERQPSRSTSRGNCIRCADNHRGSAFSPTLQTTNSQAKVLGSWFSAVVILR